MRQIPLFRGKKIGTDEWLYGSHFFDGAEEYIIPHTLLSVHDFEDYQVDPNTVGQFSGRIDADGAKLFEGDVFTVNGRYPKLMKWLDKSSCFATANLDTLLDECMREWPDECVYQQPHIGWWNDFQREIKVVGNIYDTEEYKQFQKIYLR